MNGTEDKSLSEVARNLDQLRKDIRDDIASLGRRIDRFDFVPKELYEANRQALQKELRQIAEIAAQAENRAESAWSGMRWAVGIIGIAVFGMMTTLIVAILTGGV